MILFSWLHQKLTLRQPTRCAATRKPTARFRPQLETLERRDVPSTLTVTNILDSGAGSLRAEIAAARPGDTINFARKLDNQTIKLTNGELVINKNLTIQGPGASQLTVSGSKVSRLFELDGAATNVTLSGLTLTQGDGVGNTNSGAGGAIYNDGSTLTVSACTLSGNFAPGFAGAIFNLGTLALSSCTLAGNSSSSAGGALYNGSMLTVSDCTLSDNSAAGGGALENDGTVLIAHSTLSGNFTGPFAGGSGGAIDTDGTVTITQSILSGNSAPFGAGGAISNSRTLTINQSTLSGNSALGGVGGAIAVFSLDGALEINQSLLSGNSANTGTLNGTVFVGRGGAIANDGGMAVTIKQSILSGNSADGGQGGAIYNLDGTLTIKQSILFGNSANGGQGGAIYNNSDGAFGTLGTIIINQSTVLGNSASAGGGIYNDVGGVLTVLADSIVVGNASPRGAGADLNNAGSATLIDSFVGSIAGGGSLTIR